MTRDVRGGRKKGWRYVATAGRRLKRDSSEEEGKSRSFGELLALGAGGVVAGAFFLLLARHVPTLALFLSALLLLGFLLWRRRAGH